MADNDELWAEENDISWPKPAVKVEDGEGVSAEAENNDEKSDDNDSDDDQRKAYAQKVCKTNNRCIKR
jgi:hypothetical protein